MSLMKVIGCSMVAGGVGALVACKWIETAVDRPYRKRQKELDEFKRRMPMLKTQEDFVRWSNDIREWCRQAI